MEIDFGWLSGSDLAVYLRNARWGYAAVNATHILGIALLVGAIVPLDLKLLGFWPRVPREHLLQVLVPVAVAGLVIAVGAGLLLFSVRPADYWGLAVFRIKIAVIALGILSALALHVQYGRNLEDAPAARLGSAAAISMSCWLGALVLGRLIAFAAD
ncbi:MAG: hypothetical protein RLZ98_982 [Pseudomonadota bacterium]|jgi:hypothetical protein